MFRPNLEKHGLSAICIDNSMISSAIWKNTCTNTFFQEKKTHECGIFQNCTRNQAISY